MSREQSSKQQLNSLFENKKLSFLTVSKVSLKEKSSAKWCLDLLSYGKLHKKPYRIRKIVF